MDIVHIYKRLTDSQVFNSFLLLAQKSSFLKTQAAFIFFQVLFGIDTELQLRRFNLFSSTLSDFFVYRISLQTISYGQFQTGMATYILLGNRRNLLNE